MSKNFDTKKIEKKNKKGFVLQSTTQFTPKKNQKISIDEINKFYKAIAKKYKKNNFIIRAMGIDGMKTLKSQDFIEDDLKWMMINYYRSYGIEAKTVEEKFSDYFYFEITILY